MTRHLDCEHEAVGEYCTCPDLRVLTDGSGGLILCYECDEWATVEVAECPLCDEHASERAKVEQ